MTDWQQHLHTLGLIHTVSGGIQIDINAVIRRQNGLVLDGSLCDHNCTSEVGQYTCPAAVSLNRGLVRKSMAPAEKILSGIDTVVNGIRQATDQFLSTSFPAYCEAFRVPDDVARVVAQVISTAPVEVNLFGGNPEMHPEIIRILAALGEREDIVTNFTTTGRRVMRDEAFAQQMQQYPPDVLALSADDFDDADHIRSLASKSPDELRQVWKSIPAMHGQRQKAVEAIYTAMQQAGSSKARVLFNLVIHPGNLPHIYDIIGTLAELFPDCLVNPFPAQNAFLYAPGDDIDLARLEQFIDWMIAAHQQHSIPVTRRLHYWLLLKAGCQVYGDRPRALADLISGHGIWRCYKTAGANRYVQVGKAAIPHTGTIGGGHPGCFWNEQTVTRSDVQVWDMNADDVAAYMMQGAHSLAARSVNPCPGCAFPRLLFDAISTELGMADELVAPYLELRQRHAGY